MFTGIVEEVGTVKSVRSAGSSLQLSINAHIVIQGTKLGDSISVNGVCLTVTNIHGSVVDFDVVPETFRTSSLSGLQINHHVNLERAMASDGRFGGHIVSGHVDTTGTILSMRKEENAIIIEISLDESQYLRYMVARGSVTLDGVSLTINTVTERSFTVSIIPHTFANTALQSKSVGQRLNIEVDVIAKYVERLLQAQSGHHSPTTQSSNITMDFLSKHGYMG
jgi:riboflavin synthase